MSTKIQRKRNRYSSTLDPKPKEYITWRIWIKQDWNGFIFVLFMSLIVWVFAWATNLAPLQ